MRTSLRSAEERPAFVLGLNARLVEQGIPYHVGLAQHSAAGLVCKCRVSGRGKAASRERTRAYERCMQVTAAFCLERFPEELGS